MTAEDAEPSSRTPQASGLKTKGECMYIFAGPHSDLPDLPFLVDTGAQVTMMPLSWYNSIAPDNRPTLNNTKLRIIAANKTSFAVSGVAEF